MRNRGAGRSHCFAGLMRGQSGYRAARLMCGIAGAFGAKGAQRSAIERMTRVDRPPRARRRGHLDSTPRPGSGSATAGWRSSTCRRRAPADAFGRRALRRSPTMAKSTIIAELRALLEAEGAAPGRRLARAFSDTETLLQAIAAWGLGPALERAVGMFAFALWDRQRAAAAAGPRPVRRKAALLRLGGQGPGVRVRAQGAARASRLRRRDRPRARSRLSPRAAMSRRRCRSTAASSSCRRHAS